MNVDCLIHLTRCLRTLDAACGGLWSEQLKQQNKIFEILCRHSSLLLLLSNLLFARSLTHFQARGLNFEETETESDPDH